MSRRYLGLENWEGLLRRFAELTPKPYARFRAEANGILPVVASRIAEAFSDVWWSGPDFEDSRSVFETHITRSDSALNVEIRRYMEFVVDAFDDAGVYADEIRLLKEVEVDGIITTNYDCLLEHLFPGFRPFVGQNDVLFSETQEIGEIYKIHGSAIDPNSLVLTAEDYENFNARNAYLAAKLLTIFVDHPVVFLGYSMRDDNIVSILSSIATGLTTQHLQKLQDRLIFIEWDEEATDPHLESGTYAIGDGAVGVMRAAVADYSPVYEALANRKRQFSVRVLRQLKERVYELVKTTDPVGALRVVDIDDSTGSDILDVVVGVGVVPHLGYLFADRADLLEDVLLDDRQIASAQLVEKALAGVLRHSKLSPVFKYLRGARLLDAAGALIEEADVPEVVRQRVTDHAKLLTPSPKSYIAKGDELAKTVGNFAGLVDTEEPWRVLIFVSRLPLGGQDPVQLRDFLLEHREDLYVNGNPTRQTAWIKGVLLYDWLVYGVQAQT